MGRDVNQARRPFLFR